MKSATLATALALASFGQAAPVSPSSLISRATGSGYTSGNTANDVVDGVCAPLTVIFARGSTESGNIGTVVGPGLFQSLIKTLGASGVAVQGVDYAASIEGNFDLGADGGPTMAKLAQQALSQCPDTKIALSGYSQGSMVVHHAVASDGLSAENVAAVVLFGDPELGSSVGDVPSSKLKEYCASGDGVCETHTFTITAAHLSYGADTAEAASWIISTAGASSNSSSSTSEARSDNLTSVDTTPSSTMSSSSTVSGSADSSASSSSSTSTSSSDLGSTGGLGSLYSLGSSSLPTGLSSLGGSSGLGSLGSLTGSTSDSSSTGSSGLGSLSSLGSGSSSGLSGLSSLGSGSSGLGDLSSLGDIMKD